MSERGVVIAGAGQAGFQVAASLRRAGYQAPVTLVGDEPTPPYQRPPLSKGFMTGDDGAETVRLRPPPFYAEKGIELATGDRVEEIDHERGHVELASGRQAAYDHLVLALGARPRSLAVPGVELEGVHMLRTLADAESLRTALARVERVVVIGAGFVGLELAAVAAKRGVDVTVVEALDRAMARVVSPEISAFYVQRHRDNGATVLLGHEVEAVEGRNGRVSAVRVAGGDRLAADLVVVGVGIVPNTDLAKHAGLEVDDGIVVDETLATADERISAIGDCARYPSRHAGGAVRLESVQNAVDHGRCVASRIVGDGASYTSVPWFWSDQHDRKLQIAGFTSNREHAVVRGDVEAGAFSVLCFKGGHLTGVESVNRPADHMAARALLAGDGDITPGEAASGAELKEIAGRTRGGKQ